MNDECIFQPPMNEMIKTAHRLAAIWHRQWWIFMFAKQKLQPINMSSFQWKMIVHCSWDKLDNEVRMKSLSETQARKREKESIRVMFHFFFFMKKCTLYIADKNSFIFIKLIKNRNLSSSVFGMTIIIQHT